jgi:hypothetical protein
MDLAFSASKPPKYAKTLFAIESVAHPSLHTACKRIYGFFSFSGMQVYQSLLDSLIQIGKLWREGDPVMIPLVEHHVDLAQACMKIIATKLGENPNFAKYHDLRHIGTCMRMFGSSVSTSTGRFVVTLQKIMLR